MPPALAGRVTFERVRFRYRPDAKPVLDGLDLEVRPGEVIGIVGKSGSGKSTLACLLQRLYVPEQGSVRVDGHDVNTLDTGWLRRQVAVVQQDHFLFGLSVRDNIALADPALPLAAVIRAAELAGAHEFIAALPEGYDTRLGERGATLSGGQRQRLAIARALAGSPRILVFDEATSAQDTETERALRNRLAAICRGRTVFIIAHRLSSVRHCDRIIVIEEGRIAEAGSHAALVKRNGRYAQLLRCQEGEADVVEVRHVASYA